MCILFLKDKREQRECAHFINHTNRRTHARTQIVCDLPPHQAAAFGVSSGKWGVSVIAYISLSLVEISTTVSVFTVKALPVALLLSLSANETLLLSLFCFHTIKHLLVISQNNCFTHFMPSSESIENVSGHPRTGIWRRFVFSFFFFFLKAAGQICTLRAHVWRWTPAWWFWGFQV